VRRTLTGAAAAALLGVAWLFAQSQVNGPQPLPGQVAVGKGAAFQLSRAAVINSTGLLDGVTDSTPTDCVHVDGTGGVCATGAVLSIFGRSGIVVAANGDYSFGNLSGSAVANQLPNLAGLNGVLSLAQIAQGGATVGQCMQWSGSVWAPVSCASTITSVFGRTGVVTAAANDYAFSQLSGSAAAGQLPNLSAMNGVLDLSQLQQNGATNGQCMEWSTAGSTWAPATCGGSIGGGGGAVSSVFGRTGAVTAVSGDYSFLKISGTASAGQVPGLAALNGSLLPAQIAQNGAINGQVLAWNNGAWAPGAPGGAGANFADEETPVQVDTLDYTLAYVPNPPASCHLYLEGLRMKRGVDYTLTGAGNTVTFISYYSAKLAAGGFTMIADYRY
jgi:hypothetical protein